MMVRKSQRTRIPFSAVWQPLCDFCGGAVAFTDCSEDFKLDGGFERFGALVRVDGLEEKCW
jgi:hypothetical protein